MYALAKIQHNPKRIKTLIIVITSIITVSMIILLIFMATFNTPVADQLSFIHNTKTNGVIGNTIKMYDSWGGRLIQFFTVGLSYRLFGANGAQIYVPILLLLFLGLSFTWLFHLLFKNKKPFWQSLLIGFLLAGVTLYTTYCLFDTFLWLDAALVYLLGLAMVIFDTATFIWISQQTKPLHKQWKLYPLIFIVAIGQTAGETSMAIALAWSIIILILTLIFKKWRAYRKASIVMFITLLVGSIIMLAAPGLWVRANYTSATHAQLFSINTLFIYPLKAAFKLISRIQPWQIGLIIFTILVIGSLTIKDIESKKHLPVKLLLSGILIAISFPYITFVIYFYSNQIISIESRVMTMASSGVFIGITLIGLAIYHFLYNKIKRPLQLSTILIIIISLCSIGGFLDFNRNYVSVISARRNAYIARDSYVKKQLVNEARTIEVPDIPIMLEHSGASDFTANSWVTIDWFYNSFRSYYSLTDQKLIVNGLDLVDNTNQPEWYIGNNSLPICSPASQLVIEKYWCENNN